LVATEIAMKQKQNRRLGGVKDWSPVGPMTRPFEPGQPGRPAQAPAHRRPTTWKTVAAIAIVGVVALAILQETGVLKIFASK